MFAVVSVASVSSSILVFVPPLSFGLSFHFVYGFLCCAKACQCRRYKQMQVQSLGLEDPLEKEMATHSSILAW